MDSEEDNSGVFDSSNSVIDESVEASPDKGLISNDSILSGTALDKNESQQNNSRNSDSESNSDSPIGYARHKINKPLYFDSSTQSLDESITNNLDKSPVNKSKSRSRSDSTMTNFDRRVNDGPGIFNTPQNRTQNFETSSESESDDDSVIDVSSGEEANIPHTPSRSKVQITLPKILSRARQTPAKTNNSVLQEIQPLNRVSKQEYEAQQSKVNVLQSELLRVQNSLRTVNLSALPDKGALLYQKVDSLKQAISQAERKLEIMVIDETIKPTGPAQPKLIPLEDLKLMTESVQPKTFGQQAMATLNAQKGVMLETLEVLHNSLTTRPTEEVFAEDPKGLKVELMPHQKHALAWLMWRETQKPSGGILADDMGLGKTLTMISLILKTRKTEDDDESDQENQRERYSKPKGGTLVICPASLLRQWESEVEKHCKRYLLSIELFHGTKRESKAKKLASRDLVITTYQICSVEHQKTASPLYGVKWRRIILDEAHQIRNHKTRSSIAVGGLSGKSRWALTGTPVHNRELDMYALLKFLRCNPFDDLAIWKRWISKTQTGGQDRIHTIISSIMLRRTKAELQQKGDLKKLPEKFIETINISLEPEEQAIYQKILIFSRTLFAQYLHQHAEKQGEYKSLSEYSKLANDANNPYHRMHQKLLKLNNMQEVKQHEILVLLLRLRQMCCHPSLIIKMLHGDQELDDEDITGHETWNVLEELRRLKLDDDSAIDTDDSNNDTDKGVEGFHMNNKDLMNPENPIFAEERQSTKIKVILKLLKEKLLPTKEKIIIVSQWTSLLRLLSIHLENNNIPFTELNGKVEVMKRTSIVQNFNDTNSSTRVLLLSLTAGGVGLNLVGANHMVILDLHWNPQLELQAHDRIYRVGQTRNVHIYKLITTNTIEERIKILQEHKLQLADSMLTGARVQNSKLTLADLRLLFSM